MYVSLLACISIRSYMHRQLIQDIKVRQFCQIFKSPSIDPNVSLPTFNYELPDGTTLNLGIERFTVPELLMTPDSSVEIKNDFSKHDLFM